MPTHLRTPTRPIPGRAEPSRGHECTDDDQARAQFAGTCIVGVGFRPRASYGIRGWYNDVMPPVDAATSTESEPLGLYVHVPFCETKCGYCDFYSVPLGDTDTTPLVDALIAELRTRLKEFSGRVTTIFIGGGTPTLLPPAQLDRLLEAIGELVDLAAVQEFTVEANPATVDHHLATMLRARGVDRVSMGAQSFDADELHALERLHSPDDIAPSVAVIRRAGFRRLNLDLIFGVPGQSMTSWRRSLARAIELDVDHLACYGLTYESGTRLTSRLQHGRIAPCDEELEAEMFLVTQDVLAGAGFEQYELSNFARPGQQSQHNLLYWRNQPYVGIGPSAAGCDGTRRYRNVPDFRAYVEGIRRNGRAEAEHEMLTRETLALEMILMQLRLNEGLNIESFQRRTGRNPRELFDRALSPLVRDGHVQVSATHVALTRTGRLMANRIMAELAAECDFGGGARAVSMSLPVLHGAS